jgi:hypothetical protein
VVYSERVRLSEEMERLLIVKRTFLGNPPTEMAASLLADALSVKCSGRWAAEEYLLRLLDALDRAIYKPPPPIETRGAELARLAIGDLTLDTLHETLLQFGFRGRTIPKVTWGELEDSMQRALVHLLAPKVNRLLSRWERESLADRRARGLIRREWYDY